jgi:hypothetical protein
VLRSAEVQPLFRDLCVNLTFIKRSLRLCANSLPPFTHTTPLYPKVPSKQCTLVHLLGLHQVLCNFAPPAFVAGPPPILFYLFTSGFLSFIINDNQPFNPAELLLIYYKLQLLCTITTTSPYFFFPCPTSNIYAVRPIITTTKRYQIFSSRALHRITARRTR